jgi:hypothetical protein
MNETNDVHEETRESNDDRKRERIIDEDERAEQLTTKDMTAGIAAKRARKTASHSRFSKRRGARQTSVHLVRLFSPS